MKGTQVAFSACLFNLLVLSEAQPAPRPGPAEDLAKNSPDPPNTPSPSVVTTAAIVKTPITNQINLIFPLETSTQVTQTTTLSIIPTWASLFSLRSLSQPGESTTATVGTFESVPNSPTAQVTSPSASTSEIKKDYSHRNLVIILSTVLGSLGLLLIALAACLTRRFRKIQSPFSHRGASPINDEEIASWRSPSTEHKHPILPRYPEPVHDASTIGQTQHQVWMWNTQFPKATTPTKSRHTPTISTSPLLPDSPSSIRAPNSRAGLTDETKPGAEPYIPPMKRQSSRLSKAPPGHIRSKSRRSSMSQKSIWSYNGPPSASNVNFSYDQKSPRERQTTWYDPENDHVGRELGNFDHNSDSPGTSIFDVAAGGLSPRPSSKPRLWEQDAHDKEIGRAIT